MKYFEILKPEELYCLLLCLLKDSRESQEACFPYSFTQETCIGSHSVPGIALGAGDTVVNVTECLSS